MTLYKKYLSDTSIALTLKLIDAAGAYLLIELPNCMISTGTQPDVSGDGAIMLPISFTAHYDLVIDSHIKVTSLVTP